MDELGRMIEEQIEIVTRISEKIENGEKYLEELKGYLPALNQVILKIFEGIADPQLALDVNQEFILQVLNDIIYGIEQEDTVFLLDVLRYGLLELFDYIVAELQGEE